MGPLIGDVLPLAAGIALSPVPVIAAILMLLSPRARTTAPAFLAGWFVGILVAISVFVALAAVLPESGESGPQPVLGAIKILLALVLGFLAVKRWRTRPAAGEEADLPAWMAGIDAIRAPKAFLLSFLLAAVNPKNLVLAAAAGLLIGGGASDFGMILTTVLIAAVLASLTIALPVLSYLFAAEKMAAPLDRLRGWLSQNNAAVMATLLFVFAFVLLGKGIASF